jgi:putative flavoprotein involved in K+ transport
LPDDFDAVVVGAGPAGLAVTAQLRRRGLDAVAVDRQDAPGATWRGHYDRLRLNTVRWLSHLPGHRIPRRYGPWVARDDVVSYLAEYAERLDVPVRQGIEARRLEPGAHRRWRVVTTDAPLEADSVVVATGYCRQPRIPDWPGRETFAGEVLHSSTYRNPEPYRGRDVLVVGAGNSAAEIAVDLADGGAACVRMSIRTPPQIVPRTVLGIPSITVAIATRRLPAGVGDAVIGLLQRVRIGDLSPWGIPRPATTMSRQFAAGDVVPITHPDFVPRLKARRIEVVGPLSRFEDGEVVLGDGTRVRPDAVIAATGYDRGLAELVGELGLATARDLPLVHGDKTHPAAPGIHFIGFTNPLSGNLRELRIDARRIARAVAGELGGLRRARAASAAREPAETVARHRCHGQGWAQVPRVDRELSRAHAVERALRRSERAS